MNLFFMYIYFMSLISMTLVRKHVLLCLMMLEFMVISLLLLIYYFFFMTHLFYIYIFLMCLFVCEGVLGLSCLVYFIRFFGNNYLNSMFMW
uniref:NADH dehydrogenase subunit 4L n=1 Tax=Iassus dorsalis TaxID=1962553 RepID=A0A6C0MGW5_9HEMI|nr:NADH dehydrogenase subunit 4L [Iassus dorsalis]QHV34342.1 NADH dehydrogenase subunit 4L [Iassus dorsalis]WSP02056.1 NADH dehydrogenase subunit 4L [Iassus latus]